MKKIILILTTLVWAVTALAQTPEEIIARMEAKMESPEQYREHGAAMTMDMKMPIIGTVTSRAYTKGDKIRLEIIKDGKTELITWRDGKTDWTYELAKNTIEIKDDTSASASGSVQQDADMAMFTGVSEGYDVSIRKETADAWYLRCRKSRTNTKKDDPKTMDLVVEKGTYKPLSLSAKVSIVSVTIRDIAYGVSDEFVTFDAAKYPTATFVDKR